MDQTPVSETRKTTTPSSLVEMIYASVLEPGRYDELMAIWQSHVEGLLVGSTPFSPGMETQGGGEVERHFLRAFSILERLGRPAGASASIEAMLDSNPKPAMLVSVDGRIANANAAARSMLNVTVGSSVYALALEATGRSNLRKALAALGSEPVGKLLTVSRAFAEADGTSPVLALARAPRPDGEPPVGLLMVAEIGWSDRIGAVLKGVFGLTEAECEVARGIIAGDTMDEIAATRSRSEKTVRTQVKAILRKLGVRTQTELVRLVASLTQIDLSSRPFTGHVARTLPHTRTAITRTGGRPLGIVLLGPEDGRPVLFVHGMLDGYGATAGCLEELERRSIRLIAPVRPGFGSSAPDETPGAAPLKFASDLAAVLDHFGIAACPLLGHMAGSVYAFAAAAALGPRISGVMAVSGGVPMVSSRQFAAMTARQRIVAYTARYTPRLLPLILRAGISLLDNGGQYAFMSALYENAPTDFAVARRPDVFPVLCDGYALTVAQGHRAFETDSQEVVRDWSEHVDRSDQPVILIHGRHDPVVQIDSVREHAARYAGRMSLVEVEDQGQLLFYARPDIVLDRLESLFPAR